MKKLLVLIFCFGLFWNTSTAQTPSAFKYQAVVRTNLGQIIVNQQVGFRISILKTSTTGTSVYSEKQVAQTNTFGLVTFEIGRGTVVSGTFASINWGSDAYFVKIELDANNSGTFSEIGISQLLAVPYSLYAEKAGNGFSGSYAALTDKPALFSGNYADLVAKPSLASVATSGSYADLTGKPALFTGVYTDLTSKPNLFSGSYTDLTSKPTLFSGSYLNLTNVPVFAKVATSGSYADLINLPTLFSGSYTNLTNKPTFATVSTSGSYTDLINKPTLFSGSYADLTNKPTLFSGSYLNLTNVPVFAKVATSGSYTDLINLPTLFSGSYTNLTNKPTFATVSTTGSYNDLINKPTLFSGSYADLTNKPALFSGNYTNLTNLPAFATVATSGSYNDLTNKPNILATAATPQSGDILYNNGTSWLLLAKGTNGQVLKLVSGLPQWKSVNDFLTANPVAVFTASHILAPMAQAISVDASGCLDDADLITALQVRWRWEDGGTFTAWTTTKTATNTYATEGAKNITLEVKDTQGNVGTTSKGITINNSQFMPAVFTNAASNITTTAATSGGNIVAGGMSNVTVRGICWGTAQNPTIADTKTTDGTGLGFYTSSMTGLVPGTTYYVRAYATNSTGTIYGNQVTVQAVLTVNFPTLTTTAASNITESAVTSGGNVTATGGADVTERGICWSTNQAPTIADTKLTSGTGTGLYSIQLSNLSPNLAYYARAYGVNSAGVGYGPQITFTTLKTLPQVTTKTVTSISAMGGVSGGTIVSTGGGTISDKGICWGENTNPTVTDNIVSSGTGSSAFSSAIVTAVPGTTYFIRAYAINELGTVYGDQKTFTALNDVTFYDFETGMKPAGWSGNWSTFNTGFNSNYCLRSPYGITSDIALKVTMANPGQIRFFYKFGDFAEDATSTQGTIQLIIDDLIQNTFTNYYVYNWQEGLNDLSAGNHTFIWRFNPKVSYYGGGRSGCGYLDYVIITK